MRLTPNHHRTHTTHRRASLTGPLSRQDRRVAPAAAGPSSAARRRTCPSSTQPKISDSPPRRRRYLSVIPIGLILAVVGVLVSGSVARAETVQYVALAQTLDEVLTNIRNWIMGILAGVALVFLTLGGLRYLMASTDPGETEKAKGAFKAAGIGFGLAALAPIVVEILKTIVGGV